MENEIKATELRVGNYVHDAKERLCIVDEINLYKENGNGHYFLATAINEIHTELPFKPIPITEQRLLELGFVKNNNQYSHPNCFITLSYDDEFQDWHVYETRDYFHLRTIQNIHQLQNLYHALTGQELTKKDK